MTCKSIWGTEIAFEIKNQKCIVHTPFLFTLPRSFTGSYTEDEPKFPRQNNLLLQKMVSGVDKVVNFKDLIKKSSTFQDDY